MDVNRASVGNLRKRGRAGNSPACCGGLKEADSGELGKTKSLSKARRIDLPAVSLIASY
jgi:hypothetical protein